jgi:tetratricopeptide (TPR) repeat protein
VKYVKEASMKKTQKSWLLFIVALSLICSCAHTKTTESEAPKRHGKAKTEQEVKTQKPLTAEEELKQGDHHLARGEAMVAIVHYQNALQKDPSLARAHLQMARAYGKQNKMDLYEDELKEAIKIDPELAEARYILASWYFTTGRNKEALAESEVLIKSDPENENYRLFRVMTFDATKDYQKAIEELEYLVKVYPQKPQHLLSLGGMYHKIGNEKNAKKYLQKVKEVAPETYEAKMAEEMLQEVEKKK